MHAANTMKLDPDREAAGPQHLGLSSPEKYGGKSEVRATNQNTTQGNCVWCTISSCPTTTAAAFCLASYDALQSTYSFILIPLQKHLSEHQDQREDSVHCGLTEIFGDAEWMNGVEAGAMTSVVDGTGVNPWQWPPAASPQGEHHSFISYFYVAI
jgi:hypothetical protein